MPESEGSGAKAGDFGDVPEDVRVLKDFPHYDSSLQDGPRFRQSLNAWANRTEKVSEK